jgi:hypothetical protein
MFVLSALGCCTRLDGQYNPLRTYHGVFFKGRGTSEDITRRLFLMNVKELTAHGTGIRNKLMQEANMKIL